MWREDLHMAVGALRSHRFRSSLTVLGITIGALAIVLMTSLAQSGLTTLGRSFEELGGARLLMVTPRAAERSADRRDSYTRGFTPQDRDALLMALPHLRQAALYAQERRRDVTNAFGKSLRTDLVAGDEHTLRTFNLKLGRGRNLRSEDSVEHGRVCVVAHDVARELFEGDALGKWLTMGGLRCRVVGQLSNVDHWGTSFGFEWTNFVLVPLSTWREENPAILEGALLMLQTSAPEHNDLVKRIANALLLSRHNDVADFELWDFSGVMKQFSVIFAVMQTIVGLIAGIALLVGGIGVMNMMLVSVTERVREIGIRKAIGASFEAIHRQFLLEAALLAGGGGCLGVGLGAALAQAAHLLIRHFKPSWVGELSGGAAVLALGVSLSLGLGFGFFPARRASRLDPVEAIRS